MNPEFSNIVKELELACEELRENSQKMMKEKDKFLLVSMSAKEGNVTGRVRAQ